VFTYSVVKQPAQLSELVGWTKAKARRFTTAGILVRRAHHGCCNVHRRRWWARRTRVSAVKKRRGNAFAHPTRPGLSCVESKEYRPLFIALGQGVALIPVFSLPLRRGGWRADKAPCPDCSRRCPAASRTMVHNGAPAPCGAPTRHLGLYAFDGGRTGPTPSGRRGCPSTARGRRLRLPPLAGAAPVPRLQNASGRRPSYLDRDAGHMAENSLFVKCFPVKIY
jgi:hypothetical protein